MEPNDVPVFDPTGCRYDQRSYAGRLQRFRELTDPRMLLVSDEELARAQELLNKHAKGQAHGTSDHTLWEAKRIKDAIIHPVTGEKMFLPGRMSAFVPVNTVPTVGMLLAKSSAQTVFWQWVNQSYNVAVNFSNSSSGGACSHER